MEALHGKQEFDGMQLAAMEAQLGRLAGVVRSKDSELAALNATLTSQFEERNALRGELAGLQGRLARLQGAYGALEARLRESEAAHEAAREQNRCESCFAKSTAH